MTRKKAISNISFFIILIIFSCIPALVNNIRLNSRNQKIKENKQKQRLEIPLKRIHIDPRKKFAFLTKVQNKIKSLKTSIIQHPKVRKAPGAIVPLHVDDDLEFVGEIQIGSPKQPISVIVDTGSGNLLVLSNRCNAPICKNTPSFQQDQSLTYNQLGDKIEIDFVTGGIDGELSEEDVTLGNLTIPHQTFGEILNEEGNIFEDAPFSGILGLGYPDLAIPGITPVLDNIINKDLMEDNIMTFYFGNDGGLTTFGFLDKSKYEGEIHYYPVIDKYYWTIEIKDILLDGKSLGFCKDGPCKAAVDTGTSLLTGPSEALDEILSKIIVDDDCVGKENAPNLTYIIGDEKYEITPDEYILEFKENDKKQCKALMMPADVEEPHGPLWILGVLFMQKYYTIFDRDNDRVGFAKAIK